MSFALLSPHLNAAEVDAARRLYLPFPAADHEAHPYFGFIYLKEEAINRRLTEVFGVSGWSKVVTRREFIPEGMPTAEKKIGNSKYHIPLDRFPGEWSFTDGKYVDASGNELTIRMDIPVVLTEGYMSVRLYNSDTGQYVESRRDSIGADVLTDLGKERGTMTMNTYKASDTDLLKRLARQYGIGLYLTEMDKSVNMTNLGEWINANYGPTTINEAKRMIATALNGDSRFSDPKAIGKKLAELGFAGERLLYEYHDALAALKAA